MATKLVTRGKEAATLKKLEYITSKRERSCKIQNLYGLIHNN
jgi:hypothetical protein